MDLYDRAQEAAQALRDKGAVQTEVAVVLGSGLGGFTEALSGATTVPYSEIPHFPRTNVAGHAGRVVLGQVGQVRTLAFQGRFHYYEGFPMDIVAFPMRVLKLLRVPTVILTCAAGGLDARFRAARLMLIQDHINMMGLNPLRGDHDERFGVRFPDMTHAYDLGVIQAIEAAAARSKVSVRRGIYAALAGPSYETPSEIKMLQTLGVNAVGMSTVPEAIVAHQMGIKVGAIATITNLAAGLSHENLSHDDVQKEAEKIVEDLSRLLQVAIPAIALAQKGGAA